MKKLGFGFMRLPLKDSNDSKSIDFEQVNYMVDAFLEKGFTYFDTAYMYHDYISEETLGEVLVKRHPRESYTVATKMPTMFLKVKEDLERIFAEQQTRTGLEYFDYYMLHNLNMDHYKIAEKLDAFSFIIQKKKEGKVREIGFSFHDKADLLEEILTAHPEVDFVQLQINYLDWNNDSIQSGKCYETAVKHGKKVIVMEPVKGGTLADLPEEAGKVLKKLHPDWSEASWAIRYAASLKNVMVVLSGMSNQQQLLDNTTYMKDVNPLTESEMEAVTQVVKIMKSQSVIPCTACQYCVEGCPVNIPIPKYFELYNVEKQSKVIGFSVHSVYYEDLTKTHGKASECIKCGKCESSCPQHLTIRKYLEMVSETFDR